MSDARRLPRLVVTVWVVTGLALAGLGVAVVHYLTSGRSGAGAATGMPGMAMSTSTSLFRAGGDPLHPLLGSALLTAWHLDAVALAVIVLAAAGYLTGVALVPIRRPGTSWPAARTAAFLVGLAVCAYATNGSIAVYDQVLFTAHMVGHLALVMVAPALLMVGSPLALATAAGRPSTRARLERVVRSPLASVLTAPPVALACYTVVIVGSHLTGIMNVIMQRTWAGQLEHLVYIVVGCQFFALVLGVEPIRWRLGAPARWLLLAVAMAVDTFTGVVLLQGTRTVAMLTDPRLHVDPLSDTRTGGAIMWFGGDAIMAVVMIVLVVGWLRRVDTEAADRKGWLEQARTAAFTAHTGAEAGDVETFDDDDAARASYNEWLKDLDRRG